MAKSIAIVISHGTIDAAYVALNIALTGRALDADVSLFFTFEGVNIIRRGMADSLPPSPTMPQIAEGLREGGIPPVSELLESAQALGVQLIGCQMTMDVMGLHQSDLIDGVEVGGATSFLAQAFAADVNLHV